jgi:ADP-heptose:LPS heptosyltransferase
LIIRFSSIGDIVLTTPIVRCLKLQDPTCEIHYLTKKSFLGILANNPYLDKIITIDKDIDEVMVSLRAEKYTQVIDLHNNLRTFRVKQKLGVTATAFPKLNFKKFLLTTFKLDFMPKIHVVDRYFEAVKSLGIYNDEKGLDFFIPNADEVDLKKFGVPTDFIAFAIGAQFATKRLPQHQLVKLVNKLNGKVVLLGGETDVESGKFIQANCPNVISLCGLLNLNQSASVVRQCAKLITHDTGLMHIAAAFNKPTVSIWGNTVPALGMEPYQPQNPGNYTLHQVDLKCRPCSKIGFQACPKKHFKCMENQDLEAISMAANTR